MTGYSRCSYTSLLDKILSRPHPVGQGARWEADPSEIYMAGVRLEASSTMFLGIEAKETFGADAESVIGEAARLYGRYRGEAIRQVVEKRGEPLDIPHMWANWVFPMVASREYEHGNDEPDYSPYFSLGGAIADCPFNDVWQLGDPVYPEGLVATQCEAMHTAAFQGYNPAMDLWIKALLTRGEGVCSMSIRIPDDEAEKIQRRTSSSGPLPKHEMNDATSSYQLMARQTVIIYHFWADTLLRRYGRVQAEAFLRRAMLKWGAWRGKDMRLAQQAKGIPQTLENFVRYSDDPSADRAWIATNVRLTPTEYHLEITRAAFSDQFKEIGTGPLAAIFFEEALPAQAKAYNPKLTLSVPRLMERGDAVTELNYTLADSHI